MSFSMALLLLHSSDVPPAARDAIQAAFDAPAEIARREHLTSAARILYREAGVDCDDARELVGLGAAETADCGCA